jgi:uncharacterized protein (TIGR00297 family)
MVMENMVQDPIISLALIVVSAASSIVAYKTHCLDRSGAIASFIVGSLTGMFGSIGAFTLLMVFTIAGFAATMKDLRSKMSKGLQEGKSGERGWKNILGVSVPALIIVFLDCAFHLDPVTFSIMYISTLAVAGSDTIASEIGVRDPKVYMITNFKRVEPGINGGVSVLGTVTSTVAALIISILGWAILQGTLELLLLIPFAMGVLGNLLDSLFGALFENRGYISKYANNAITGFIPALVGAGMYHMLC